MQKKQCEEQKCHPFLESSCISGAPLSGVARGAGGRGSRAPLSGGRQLADQNKFLKEV